MGATEEPVFVGVLSPSVDSLITSSHTRTAARKSPPEPMGKHDGKTRNKLVTAAVLLTMGTGSALALYDDAPAGRPPAAVATAPETAPPTAPTAAVSEEAPRRIRILLRSTPPGASVVIGDRRYGPTPAEIEWTGEDARIGREVKFQFQLEGHRDHTITRTLYGDALSVEATLERVELDLR